MKKLLLFIFSLVFSATVFCQKVDTVTSDAWKNNTWQHTTRTIYSYNSQCLTISFLLQTWQQGSSSWADTLLYSLSYNSNNEVSQSIAQIWNKNTSTWDNFLRQTYSYNSDDLLDSLLSEFWMSNNWQKVSLTTNTYNANATLEVALNQVWISGWFNASRTNFTYYADKTINQAVNQTWNFVFSSWDNSSRNTYTYNAQAKELTNLTEIWQGNQWKNSVLNTNTYDGNNYLTNLLTQKWNNSSSSWENDAQTNYSNNSDGTPAVSITQDWDTGTSTWTNNSRSTFSYAGCSLPLTLLSFTGAVNGKEVQLQWVTTTEINTKNFVVQRSTDAMNFENIGVVNAAGNSAQKTSYQFNDAGFNKGANKIYYRLQMVDNDGKFAYSKIASVIILPDGKLFIVYPNPVKDNLFITTNSTLSMAEIKIMDQTGKMVFRQQVENIQANNSTKINIANLQKGIYYLQLISGSNVQSTKFIKD